MNIAASLKPIGVIWGTVFLVIVLTTGLGTAFYARASSPSYQALFWGILPAACIHLGLAVWYFLRVRHWSRWAALSIAALAGLLFGELVFRAWL
jgi:hypothetical protein